MIASMGNIETHADQTTSCNSGKIVELTEDGKSTVPHDIKDNAADNNGTDGEVNETTTLNSLHHTNCASVSVFDPNSGSCSNSASLNDEENARLWQEVALRYQQILCKEYKMLNQPFCPWQSGGMYLYYVPVVINGDSTQQNSGVDNEQYRDAYRNSKEVAGGKDRINDLLEGSRLRQEQFRGNVQPVEGVSLDMHHGSLRKKSGETGYDADFHQSTRNDSPSPSMNTKQSLPIAGKLLYDKTEEKHNAEQLEKLSEKTKSEDNDEDLSTNEYFLDSNVQPNERFIRVFKGYTIEYHPTTEDSRMAYPNTTADVFQSGEKKEKIKELRTCLTRQEEELGRMKLQHLMRDVSPRSSKKDFTRGEFTNNTLSAESIEQLKQLSKSFGAGKNPHLSGGNFPCLTPSLPPHRPVRRLPRKQKLSYRIHPMSNDEPDKDVADQSTNKMSVNLKLMGKKRKTLSKKTNRKSNERIKSRLHQKRAKSPCKSRSLPNDRLNTNTKKLDSKLKRRRPQSRRKIDKEPSLKGYELWIKRVWEKLKNQPGSNAGETLPHKLINQDEFLFTFGLVRKKDQ